MNKSELLFKYILFAFAASVFNISAQYISLFFYKGTFSLYLAIFWGTLAGLLLKYILDKKYIFCYQPKNKTQDFLKFAYYSATGVATTLIFWGFELGFNYFWNLDSAKFIGAYIGLAVGYFIKYNLDKKFVFL